MARKTKDKISIWYLIFVFIMIMLVFTYIQYTMIFFIIWLVISLGAKFLNWKKMHSYKISDIEEMEGLEFEHYVAKLLTNEGFKDIEVTQGSNDFGIDILGFYEDKSYAIQVKRYEKNVSRTAVSDAISGKNFYGCDKAMVITNSYFTRGAIEMAKTLECELVDKDILVEWIYRYNQI